MKIFDKRLQVWVFAPAKDCPLTWADLLVYSNLAYQDRYGKHPNNSRVAWATGLSVDTVTASLKRLQETGCYQDRKPLDKPDWFRQKKDTSGDHWSTHYVTWNCLVRADDAPIKVPDVMVFSYLACKHIEKFTPPDGWSTSYLATVLLIDRRTVNESLSRLAQADLFKIDEDGSWLVADALVGIQLEWFKEKAAKEARVLKTFTPNPGVDTPTTGTVRLAKIGHAVNKYIQEMTGEPSAIAPIVRRVKEMVLAADKEGKDWKPIVDQEIDRWQAEQAMAAVADPAEEVAHA